MLEKYWNSGKMPITMNKVMKQVISPFYFFLNLGQYYQEHNFKRINFQNDELFRYLNEYLDNKYLNLKDGGKQLLIKKIVEKFYTY